MRKKNTTKKTPATRKSKPISPPLNPMTIDHEADKLKQLLRNPKSDATAVDILTSALVDLSNHLGVGFDQPDIAWCLYLEANDHYDPERDANPWVERAFSDIREILNGASRTRLKAIAGRREHEEGSPELAENDTVLQASYELLHNPKTPRDLYEAIAHFYCDQSNECTDDLWHSMPYLSTVLSTVKPGELMGAAPKVSKGKKVRHAAN